MIDSHSRTIAVEKALRDYMAAVEQMNAAMKDGINVHGALANLVGATDNANDALSPPSAPAAGDEREALARPSADEIRAKFQHDPNWPIQSFDAQDWAKAFCKKFHEYNRPDEGTMLAWFAGALMRGWDEHSWQYPHSPAAPSLLTAEQVAAQSPGFQTLCRKFKEREDHPIVLSWSDAKDIIGFVRRLTSPAPAQENAETANARLTELRGDKDWTKRYFAGDKSAIAEYDRLIAIISSGR